MKKISDNFHNELWVGMNAALARTENYHSDGIVYLDTATDDMHPGIKSNQLLCDSIYRRLNDRP